MGPLGVRADSPPAAARAAWAGVRARWGVHALLGAGVGLVALALWGWPPLALLPLAGVAVPAVRRALLDALFAAPGASLAFLLAVVAAAAVGYASGGAVAPVVAWALVALLGQRLVVLLVWTGLFAAGRPSADRVSEWSAVALALVLVGVGWGLGWLPAVGDGAVAAVCTLAAGGVLRA